MSKINLLEEDVINKIAAGEVVERPASIVKELVENSLDSGATQINITIKNAGKFLIKVTDNGEGMDEIDAQKSIQRHATSKIQSADDLFAINTLGFRGEALSSIAAVSKLTILTKQKGELEGFHLMVEGGIPVSSGVMACKEGTTIEVKDMFFNTPVRKKFLKTDQVELRHIVDIVTKYALANPNTSFKLTHDNNIILNAPAHRDERNNIASIYGINVAKDLLEVNFKDHMITLTGFIAKPHQSRSDKSHQVLFVNNRSVRNNDISTSIYNAYHSLLLVGKHPIFILSLTLNPDQVDVNVHPQKSEIKIEQKDKVMKSVYDAIKQTLQTNNLIPTMDFQFEHQQTFGTPTPVPKPKEDHKYTFEPSKQTVFQVQEAPSENYSQVLPKQTTPITSEHQHNNYLPQTVKLPQMKILGQVHKTFFVAETPGGILFIDQHVVQERVLYEQFMKEYMNKTVATQTLLSGELIDVSPTEKILIQEHKDKLLQLGFQIEPFGHNTFAIKTVPTIFGKAQPRELFKDVLSKLKEGKNKLEEIQEEIITMMSCRSSIKAGDVVSIPQIEKLLKQLSECTLPFTCPHGRSILIKVPVDELEKKFKRK